MKITPNSDSQPDLDFDFFDYYKLSKFEEVWSDSARQAAIEARRAKAALKKDQPKPEAKPESSWPIADDVVRKTGSKYETKMIDAGNEWEKSLTAQEKGAVQKYTGSGHDAINTYLRTGKVKEDSTCVSSIQSEACQEIKIAYQLQP